MLNRRLQRSAITLGLVVAVVACSDDDPAKSNSSNNDSGPDGISGPSGTLKGLIKNTAGKAVGDAKIKAGSASTTANFKGEYELEVPVGDLTMTVSAAWHAQKDESVTIAEGETKTLDIELDVLPLKIEADDRALAETYNGSYDWKKGETSIIVVESATAAALWTAAYFRNPAHYRDTSDQAVVTPDPKPSIDGNGGTGFNFLIADLSKQVLVESTIVDALDKTEVPADRRAAFIAWTPMLKFVKGWDAEKSTPLSSAGATVEQQQWGGDGVYPQRIEQVWLNTDELWVSVAFEPFVELDASVTDSDGDGRKEIYAKLNPELYSKEMLDAVTADFVGDKRDTLGAKEVLDDIINALYDVSDPTVIGTLGEPYEVPAAGTISYPFAVLEHTNKVKNVLVVGP